MSSRVWCVDDALRLELAALRQANDEAACEIEALKLTSPNALRQLVSAEVDAAFAKSSPERQHTTTSRCVVLLLA